MDPSQMYSGGDHGTWFYVTFLIVAVLVTVGLMGGLVLGISRSYRTPSDGPSRRAARGRRSGRSDPSRS